MRILIAAIGRLKDKGERELYERYAERIDAYAKPIAIGPIQITEIPESRAVSVAQRKADEADALLKALVRCQSVIALDETGKGLSSVAFSKYLGKQRDAGLSPLGFAIGGPDGHGEALLSAAHLKLSLGPMTFPHGLVRVLLAEQIYRAATLLAGHPYHRA